MRVVAGLAALAAAVAALAAGCGGEAPADDAPAPDPASAPAAEAGVDPRDGGLEIAMGEWELTAEAGAIRPGPVTFVIANRGAMPHGFEIENESGPDDAVKVESRLLGPGESVQVELDLAPGVYKLECFVEGHDDLGMEMLLEVRGDAPLRREAAAPADSNAVAVAGFAYEPQELTVAAGETVTWANDDEAGHTVTHEGDAFGSETLARGGTFEHRFDRPGRYRYLCALHPEMRGTVVVTR